MQHALALIWLDTGLDRKRSPSRGAWLGYTAATALGAVDLLNDAPFPTPIPIHLNLTSHMGKLQLFYMLFQQYRVGAWPSILGHLSCLL